MSSISRRLNAELVVIFACMCPFTARPLHYADQLMFLPSCPFRAITVGAGGARVASIHCSIPLLMMSSELNFRVGSVASLHLSLDGAIMLYCRASTSAAAVVVAHHFSRSGTKCARITTATADDGRTHSAVFFGLSPAEMRHPNWLREVDGHAKLHIWTTFKQNLQMDPGENPG